jgi:hypothetical protein
MSTVTGVVDPFRGGGFMVAVAFASAFVSFVVLDFVEVDADFAMLLKIAYLIYKIDFEIYEHRKHLYQYNG